MKDRHLVRFDLHTHTYLSPDSTAKLADIVRAVQRRGLDGIAVTDHNRVEGALKLRELAPFPVIVGEEIETAEGEIIGLFLSELVPARLSPEETIARIRAQGGLVYVPHPFDRVRRGSHLTAAALRRILGQIDLLEVINSRTTFPWDNRRAERFCALHNLHRGAGSDAHLPREIGQAWVELSPFGTAEEFLHGLERGRAVGHVSSPLVHLATRWVKLRRRWGPRGSERG
ncbi:MAG: PHP domain-containing protein [Chloroflexi bacterium]|nr:PHP domain-containing protein [Chloroflexota bacterium]